MHRSGAAVIALSLLLLLPGILLAQEERREAATEERHTVERGESLWSLARLYFDDPFVWRDIYEANRERIDNPHWIYPGQHLLIPGRGGTGEVTGVEVAGGERRGAGASGLAPAPGEPTVFSEPPRDDTPRPGERTAFHREDEREVLISVVGRTEGERLALPRDLFYAASWVVPSDEEVRFPGRIEGWFGADEARQRRRTVHPHDRLRISWEGAPLPERGDRLQVVRPDRVEADLGTVIRPTGMVRVEQVSASETEGVVAMATNGYDQIRIGDRLLPAPAFPLEPGEYPAASDDVMTARLVGLARPRSFQQLGDVAFLDVGRADGVRVGDEFIVEAGSGGGWSAETVGRVQVVRTFEGVSSARIVELEGPVFVTGTELRRARRMR